ncbi:MAG: carbamoyltransferase HypF [Burkholderiales bacterium]|nr:carbamoyltransferase HypF [Burkholderiales bacterium]
MRRHLILRGLVQGVGCRPWICQEARQRGLRGWVRNASQGVELLIEGTSDKLDAFCARLRQMPFPARVESIDELSMPGADWPEISTDVFEILPSIQQKAVTSTRIGADLAPCALCLNELFDPACRRWRHPFIHCPQCGPRYTVVRSLPFDREHTSMATFALCPLCQQEVTDAGDRRFHDQTNCCPSCGPRLRLLDNEGQVVEGDPIAATLTRLRAGQIVAIKGIGGFHLCCDALNPSAIQRLRRWKTRPSKPFAVMACNPQSLQRWVQIQPHERTWLEHPGRPIVLLRQTPQAQQCLAEVAPGLTSLGAMLPYAPVHHLLFHEAAGRPSGTAWLQQAQDLLLVMTSANPQGAPLIIANNEAQHHLRSTADAVLLHDRDILWRNDDSVLRVRSDGTACWLRRGRGFAPDPLPLPSLSEAPGILAMGGDLKATLCRIHPAPPQPAQATLSPHLGDLDGAPSREGYHQLAENWAANLAGKPGLIACDLHPDFYSHRVAVELAHARETTVLPVQHHHAHIGAVLAEQCGPQLNGPAVIGLALDGFGMGPDGTSWGGELLWVQGAECERLGHLLPLPLPGGEKAAREPWRLAAGVLAVLGCAEEIERRFASQTAAPQLQRWLQSGAPLSTSSSLGRLFDAAAALLGLTDLSDYEGHAAMLLESVAAQAPSSDTPAPPCVEIVHDGSLRILDWRPLMYHLCRVNPSDRMQVSLAAAAFHISLAKGLARWAIEACQARQVDTVVLTGGCLANRLLDELLTGLIQAKGLTVWRAAQYPCGDGGLSLGQAWVALQHWRANLS